MRGVVLDSSIKDWKVVVSTPSPALIESSETCSLLVSISTPDTVSLSELFNNIQQCFRSGVTGRGEAGARLVPRLQQADQTSAEHDSEGSGRVWTGFHSAHQRCKYSQRLQLIVLVNIVWLAIISSLIKCIFTIFFPHFSDATWCWPISIFSCWTVEFYKIDNLTFSEWKESDYEIQCLAETGKKVFVSHFFTFFDCFRLLIVSFLLASNPRLSVSVQAASEMADWKKYLQRTTNLF